MDLCAAVLLLALAAVAGWAGGYLAGYAAGWQAGDEARDWWEATFRDEEDRL